MNPLKNMLHQAQQLQAQMLEAQNKLKNQEVVGLAGGDLVQVTLLGSGEVKAVSISPTLMNPEEKEVLEDLLVAALREGRNKVEEMSAAQMGSLTGGVSLPKGIKFPFL